MSQMDASIGGPAVATPLRAEDPYQAPAFEVISLDCEITSYAPGGDEPLF
jgi:hypothetical protein